MKKLKEETIYVTIKIKVSVDEEKRKKWLDPEYLKEACIMQEVAEEVSFEIELTDVEGVELIEKEIIEVTNNNQTLGLLGN